MQLAANLANRGELSIALAVDGQTANTVTINTGTPSAATADFYIAPNGNDAWSGTLAAPNTSATDGPFATLSRAQLAPAAGLSAATAGRLLSTEVRDYSGVCMLVSPPLPYGRGSVSVARMAPVVIPPSTSSVWPVM